MEVRVVSSSSTSSEPRDLGSEIGLARLDSESPTNSSVAAAYPTESAAAPQEAAALVPGDNFADLEASSFFEDEGEDLEGRIVVRIVGKYLPVELVTCQQVQRYVQHKFDELLSLAGPDRHVSLLYIHSECESFDDNPLTLLSLRTLLEGLSPDVRQRFGAVYILHPSLSLRLGLWLIGSWLPDRFYSKLAFISRVEFLAEHMDYNKEVEIPRFVRLHDDKLEAHPLMDYGFQVDKAMARQHLPAGAT